MGRSAKLIPNNGITPATKAIKNHIKTGQDRKDISVVFSVLKKLEENNMNKYKTAADLGIGTMTVYRYFNDFWLDYERQKAMNAAENKTIERIQTLVNTAQAEVTEENKVEVLTAVGSIRETLTDSFYFAVEEFDRRVKDPVMRRKMASKDLVQHINNMLPYLLKKESDKSGEDSVNDAADDFMSNFIDLMQQHKKKTE